MALLFAFSCDEEKSTPVDGDSGTSDILCDSDENCPEEFPYCSPVLGICTVKPLEDGDEEEAETGDQPSEAEPEQDSATDGDGCSVIQCPEEVNFGSVLIGETREFGVEVASRGSCDLILREVTINPEESEFSLKSAPDLPQPLSPGNSTTFNIAFSPSYGYEAADALYVVSNADNQPLCRIKLTSEYKGTSKISFAPEELQFGNVRVGDPALELSADICNQGTGNRAIRITAIGLKMPGTVPHFSILNQDELPKTKPVYVNPGQCFTVRIAYQPTEETFWPQEHENFLVVKHDANLNADDSQGTGTSELRIAGSANAAALYVTPNPVNFGDVVIGATQTQTLTIQNQAGKEVQVTNILLTGNHCLPEFEIYFGTHGEFPFTMTSNEVINDVGVGYRPGNTGLDQGCYLMIETDLPGNSKYTKISLEGYGKEANKKPVARISRSSSGSDISQPIDIPPSATEAQRRINLFGDISQDPEHQPLTYKWSLLKPAESNTVIWQKDTDMNISLTVDWPGPYTVSLAVTDQEGMESDPKNILINVATNEKVTVSMEFSGEGDMNVELIWRAPSGQTCSDEVMTSQRTCNLGSSGSAFVSNYTDKASNGTMETIVHPQAVDGTYVIQAVFKENCASFNLGWICLQSKSTTATIKIYVDMESAPRYTRSASLTEKGQTAEWRINKVGGTWGSPNP